MVHATQAAAIERAQALASLPLTSRPQREAIAAALAGVKIGRRVRPDAGPVLRNGVGVHHAGMLPRYRRLVERLAGEGLLPVICGTDTLGVGVNIPIRTVLMTALTKFDGYAGARRSRPASSTSSPGGPAGPGSTPTATSGPRPPSTSSRTPGRWPRRATTPRPAARRPRPSRPNDFVHYDEKTFDRLIAARPEPLTSRGSG